MRAAEFLNEYAEHFNGIDLSLEIQKDDEYVDDDDYDNQVVYVTATSNGRELGHVLFSFDGEYLMPQDLEVEERFRGQGIAQTMYDYVKSKGYKIRRSGQQTDAGAGFWDKHRPEQNVWEVTNPDIHRSGFKHRQEIGDFVYTAEADNDTGWGTQLIITVYDGKKEIAQTEFIMDEETDSLESANTWVLPDYQELGIASTMYAYAKMLGNDIVPSRIQTDQGNAMWRSWNQSKQSKHILPRGHKGYNEYNEDISRRGFLQGVGAAAALGAGGAAQAKIAPTPKPVATNPSAELLLKWAKKFITDPAELAAFMAQCAHESDNFRAMEEYGSPERFAKKYDIQYNPAKAKQLGNDKPGDGVKYRGRGYIQLTGKYNYQKASEWISKYLNHPVDFVKNPDLVSTPTAAALSSLWYWKTFVKPRTQSFRNTTQVTKNINPGMRGQQNREQKARDWQAALNVKPIKPGKPVKVASR